MRSSESNLAFFENEHSSILQVLLGEYKFYDYVEIVHPFQTANLFPDSTELHESQHLHMCSSTTFGLFQKHLGILIRDHNLPSSLQTVYQHVLNYSIDCSWITHEGVATAVELVLAVGKGPEPYQKFIDSMPKKYREANEPFRKALFFTRLPSFFGMPFCEALGHLVLATNILDDMLKHDNFLSTDWNTYFLPTERNPDMRLRILFQEVLEPELLQQLSDMLWKLARYSFNGQNLSPEELLNRYNNLKLGEKVILGDQAITKTISTLRPKLPFLIAETNPPDIYNKFGGFLDSWLEDFKIKGISLQNPPKLLDTTETINGRVDHGLNISYRPQDKVTYCINLPNSAQLWDNIRKTTHLLYIYFLYNSAPVGILIDEEELKMIEPGGGFFRMHAIVRSRDFLNYVCPLNLNIAKYSSMPCSIHISANDLLSIFDQLMNIDHILVMHESTWLKVSKRFGEQSPFHHSPNPICIIPEKNTLRHWESILDREINGGMIWLFKEEIELVKSTFCVLVTKNGRTVYTCPTSKHVTDRLLEKRSGFPEILTQRIPVQFGLSSNWNDRRYIFMHHYTTLGF